MKLILIRHGETEKNAVGQLHDTNDAELLNNTGKEQIHKTAHAIAQYKPSIVYSSHEKRAIESGRILASELDVEHKEIDDFQERSWGIYSGKPWSEISKVLDPMSLEERYTFIPEEGESWKTFEERLISALKNVIAENPSDNIVIVSHGGSIRALMPHLLNVPKEESFKYDPDNASITVFEVDGEAFEDEMVNNTDHLE